MRQKLLTLLSSFQFNFQDEKELQDGIAAALIGAGMIRMSSSRGTVRPVDRTGFQREYSLSRWDRPDFLIEGIAIEVKIGGTLNNLLRQLHRYAGFDEVESVIVITNRSRLAELPDTLNGKPLSVVLLRGGF